jgi:hypothetical protein
MVGAADEAKCLHIRKTRLDWNKLPRYGSWAGRDGIAQEDDIQVSCDGVFQQMVLLAAANRSQLPREAQTAYARGDYCRAEALFRRLCCVQSYSIANRRRGLLAA